MLNYFQSTGGIKCKAVEITEIKRLLIIETASKKSQNIVMNWPFKMSIERTITKYALN